MEQNPLDEAVDDVRRALARRGAPEPDVLMLLGTGAAPLPVGYRALWRVPLEVVNGVPRCWRSKGLVAAESGGATFWVLEDAPGEDAEGNLPARGEAPWERAFPCWLAAASGASLFVHTSAGSALQAPGGELQVAGSLALVRDHINLSGGTPLAGLCGSRLGPLFPDQTSVHHPGLRRVAARRAAELGLHCTEAVAACTFGPALETEAERSFYARAGASVAVQGLADPLIACAHAGLAGLAVVAVIATAGPSSIPAQIRAADRLAPALEELLSELASDLASVARELATERSG